MHPLISPDYLWLAEALLTALIAGLALSLAVGVLLLVRPHLVFAIGRHLNRWVDTSEAFRRLERPRSYERFFYRHHRLVGALISLGAGFVLWRWLLADPRATARLLFAGRYASVQWDWLGPALDAIIVALHVFVLAVGSVIFVRPSLLKGIEKAANQWHRVPGAAPLDTVVATLDEGFALYPRVAGLVLVVTAGGCLVALLATLLRLLRSVHG